MITLRRVEADDNTPSGRARRASSASRETISDRNKLEREVTQQLLGRLDTLKRGLQARLLGADGGLTDFRQANLRALLANVDAMIVQATADLAEIGGKGYEQAGNLGSEHVGQALKAAQLVIAPATPGLDRNLVTSAFDNTVDLLSAPMQQFATDVKVAVRRVALAGDTRMGELQRLQGQISGQGFQNAAYRAERIIRTELGRTFSVATFERLKALSADFPFLRKGWRSSSDSRTRTGHRQAGATYARGKGIPVDQPFVVNVYDERKGKTPKLIGQATLLFPLDPNAQPAGRIAAGATIMCRCNAFVDFDVAEFAAFARQRVQVALPAVPAAPKPVALPKPKAERRKPVRVRAPKVKVPTAAQVVAQPVTRAVGDRLSDVVVIKGRTAEVRAKISGALAEIDRLHGATMMHAVPLKLTSTVGGRYGAYTSWPDKPHSITITKSGFDNTPLTTTWHEIGHMIDHRLGGWSRSWGSERPNASSVGKIGDAMDAWRRAMIGSRSVQTLRKWASNAPGTPQGISRTHLNYLLSAREMWARAYAQYVAVESGNAAGLAEIRRLRGTVGDVTPDVPYNTNRMGDEQVPGSWEYPKQWDDDDFEPIRQAMDLVFEAAGWRKPK